LIASPAILDRKVATLDMAGFAQTLAERAQAFGEPVGRTRAEIPDHRNGLTGFLVYRHSAACRPDQLGERGGRAQIAQQSGHLEPAGDARVSRPQRADINRPLAGIVGHEGDPSGLHCVHQHGVEPERLPAVIEPVEQPRMVAVQVNGVCEFGAVDQTRASPCARAGPKTAALKARPLRRRVSGVNRHIDP